MKELKAIDYTNKNTLRRDSLEFALTIISETHIQKI